MSIDALSHYPLVWRAIRDQRDLAAHVPAKDAPLVAVARSKDMSVTYRLFDWHLWESTEHHYPQETSNAFNHLPENNPLIYRAREGEGTLNPQAPLMVVGQDLYRLVPGHLVAEVTLGAPTTTDDWYLYPPNGETDPATPNPADQPPTTTEDPEVSCTISTSTPEARGTLVGLPGRDTVVVFPLAHWEQAKKWAQEFADALDVNVSEPGTTLTIHDQAALDALAHHASLVPPAEHPDRAAEIVQTWSAVQTRLGLDTPLPGIAAAEQTLTLLGAMER